MKFNILYNESGDPGSGGGGGDPGAGGGASLITPPEQAPGASAAPLAAGAQPPAGQGGAFDFRTLIGDDGRFVPNYHEKLPESFREHGKHFAKYGDPIQALQHTLNLQQLLGSKADAVVIPAADAGPEAWAPVLKRLGVPDSPDGYGLKVPEKLPEGVKVDEAELKEFATFAHGIGLTPQQVAKLQEFDLGRVTKSAAASATSAAEIEAAEFGKQQELLKKEWGSGPDAIKKNALAQRAALTFGFSAEEIKSDPLFRNARFVMTLAKMGASMSEDSLTSGENLNSAGGMKAKAQDVINNPNNPLHAKYWAGDEVANEQVRNWLRAG